MAARHRALARLHRHVPHVSAPDERPLSGRVGDRATEDANDRVLAGESLAVRTEVVDKRLRTVTAGPNAPLMIRLVRHPYALHPVKPGRRPDTERPMIREFLAQGPAEYPVVRELIDEDRVEMPGSPMERDLPEPPPRPFGRIRRASEDWIPTIPVEVE